MKPLGTDIYADIEELQKRNLSMIPVSIVQAALNEIETESVKVGKYGDGLIGTAFVREVFEKYISNYSVN